MTTDKKQMIFMSLRDLALWDVPSRAQCRINYHMHFDR